MADRRLPVSVVTGFLGSGKTTLLSRFLTHARAGETAVIVNELGEVAIDHHLLRQVDERTVLLGNGCVCCSLRGDLADELRDLLSRRERGEIPAFRRVVVETTGLAEPAPIVATLVSEPAVRHRCRLESIVAAVDAVNGWRQLERRPEPVKQAAAADCLVITKIDLVEPAQVARLEERLARLNPAAPILRTSFGDVEPEQLFGNRRRSGLGGRQSVPQYGGDADGHVHGDVRALTLTFERPLDWTAFGIWLTMLLQARGQDILRVKGLVDTGGPGPVVLNGVQHAVHPPVHLAAWPDRDRRSRIVFVARNVERSALERSLAAFSELAPPLSPRGA
jgi:G3E family GTPase